MLKYETGQKYNVHHDYGKEDVGLACGPRILTFFLYLSDVEEGGETAFPSLGIAVKPKKGKALLWVSSECLWEYSSLYNKLLIYVYIYEFFPVAEHLERFPGGPGCQNLPRSQTGDQRIEVCGKFLDTYVRL